MNDQHNKQIEITFVAQNITLSADLLWGSNPEMCQQLCNLLPYSSVQVHTMASGNNLCHVLPTFDMDFSVVSNQVNRVSAPPGGVFIYSPHRVTINYGETYEDKLGTPIAQIIPEDIKTLEQIGQSCWDNINYHKNQANIITLRLKKDTSAKSLVVPKVECPQSTNPKLKHLMQTIMVSIQAEWLTPPEEIIALYQHKSMQKTGSYAYKRSTLVFVEGEVRHIAGFVGYGIVDSLLKSFKLNPQFDLKLAKQIFTSSVQGPVFFLEHCKLNTFATFFNQTLSILPSIVSNSDFIHLLEILAMYGNMSHIWHLHYFPWAEIENKG